MCLGSKRTKELIVLAMSVAVAFVTTASADTLHVPGDFPTIQAAIDAAMDGDEVEVHPGTYNETINFLGKAIRVYSTDGPDVTIIDAQQTGTVVTCDSGEGPDTVLEGFTITGAPREAAAAGRCPRTSWIVSIDSAAPKRTCWPLKCASAWLIRSVTLRRRAEVLVIHTAPGQGRRAPLEISIMRGPTHILLAYSGGAGTVRLGSRLAAALEAAGRWHREIGP